MQANLGKTMLALPVLATLLALGGCSERVEDTQPPPPANVEINRQGMEGAKDERAAAGVRDDNTVRLGVGDTSVMDPDVLIAEKVKTALAANPDFGPVPIEVQSDEGEVTLRGRVPDLAARDRATEIARAVRDVKDVDNQLTVG